MDDTSGDDGPGAGVGETAHAPAAAKRRTRQALGLAEFATGKRPASSPVRVAGRPINLERRARFSRSYAPAP